MMKHFYSRLGIARWKLLVIVGVLASVTVAARQQAPAAGQAPPSQQPSDVSIVITGGGGTIPHYAVPDFVALNAEAGDLAKQLAQVLWDDLAYEREIDMIPRDTTASIPVARTPDQIAFDSWRELNVDAVVYGTVQKTGKDIKVQVRLYNVRTRQQAFGSEYSGTDQFPRNFAHNAADDIYKQQRNLRGVARTKLAFISDRERQRVRGTGQQNRESKEVWISDYDGSNQRRITLTNELNAGPSWSPDGRAIAYSSWRKVPTGGGIDIYVSRIFQGILENPTKGRTESNMQPVYSPDGTRIAFASNRSDSNNEIYVMNVDGSGLRRLTNHPAADAVPTWSPNGAQIAFTSDRSGTPQIYIMSSTDGSGLRKISSESNADRATWSPAPYNEIAFAAKTGPGYDIKVFDLSTGETHQLTFGEGSNESPSYSPNGRHLAFMSTRRNGSQIFTMTRDGRDVRQITTTGSNVTPSWSN
jgi:TolB protein